MEDYHMSDLVVELNVAADAARRAIKRYEAAGGQGPTHRRFCRAYK